MQIATSIFHDISCTSDVVGKFGMARGIKPIRFLLEILSCVVATEWSSSKQSPEAEGLSGFFGPRNMKAHWHHDHHHHHRCKKNEKSIIDDQ